MVTTRIFVSHTSQDEAFCRSLVSILRVADTDVWYDEQSDHADDHIDEITQELQSRPIFIVLLSPAAFASPQVKDEVKWAYNLLRRYPERVILPVTAAQLTVDLFNTLLFLETFKRIEESDYRPFEVTDAAKRVLRALGIALPPSLVEDPTTAPVEPLLLQGRSLAAQERYAEALTIFQRIAEQHPRDVNAWFETGKMLREMQRYDEALVAYDQAIAADPDWAGAWSDKVIVLGGCARSN